MSSHLHPDRAPQVQMLTSHGAGAVAVIEVRGLPLCETQRFLAPFLPQPARELSTVPPGRVLFGSWNGEDVVVVRTAETVWEIHCHGGYVAVDRILFDLRQASAEVLPNSAEDTSESSHPGDSAFREIVMRTAIRCRTRKTAGLVLAQLSNSLAGLRQQAISANAPDRLSAVHALEKWKHIGEHVINPWRIVLAGAPNVGKSSILNSIAGLQRSIVSGTAGTTRDLIELEIPLDGWMFQFIDTAGVRDVESGSLEHLGIQQSLESLEAADLVCLVVDSSQPHAETGLMARLEGLKIPVVVLWNKSDLLAQATAADFSVCQWETFQPDAEFRISALTGDGLTAFCQWLVKRLIPDEPQGDSPILLPGLL